LTSRPAFLIVALVKYPFQLLRKDRCHILHRVARAIESYPALWQSLGSGRNPLDDQIPWITFEARHFVERVLTPESIVFEYGSGGSTLFSKRVKQVISVEHDAI
jgi:hypothetical protein